MRHRSIGTRLTLWYTSLLTVTFIFLGSAAYGLMIYSGLQDVDSALKSVADVLAGRTRERANDPFPPDLDQLFQRFYGFSPNDRYFEIFDMLGRRDRRRPHPPSDMLPLSPNALHKATQGIASYETVNLENGYPVRVLTMPVNEAGRVANLFQVGMSLENMYKTRRRFLLIMAALFPLALLLAGGGGWFLARRALEPVDTMATTARRISAERLDKRLQESGTGDELDRLAKTINDMLSRLDDSFQEIRQFSADASHELQTPLTVLKGEIEVALRTPRSQDEYQQVLKSCLEEIDRITHLVEGLLLLARSDAGVLKMDRQPMDLALLLEEVHGKIDVLAQKRSIHFVLQPVESIMIPGDQQQLRRLLMNLVENAIKYTPDGGKISLSLKPDGEWAVVQIKDTGVGISIEDQKKILTRFYRAAEARTQATGGAGLGLCIAQSIVDAHGGKIEIESTPGQGSTFTVLLPLLT